MQVSSLSKQNKYSIQPLSPRYGIPSQRVYQLFTVLSNLSEVLVLITMFYPLFKLLYEVLPPAYNFFCSCNDAREALSCCLLYLPPDKWKSLCYRVNILLKTNPGP